MRLGQLEGVPQRAGKQTIGGKLPHIEWTNERCVLPTVDGFEGSGSLVWPKGVTGNLPAGCGSTP